MEDHLAAFPQPVLEARAPSVGVHVDLFLCSCPHACRRFDVKVVPVAAKRNAGVLYPADVEIGRAVEFVRHFPQVLAVHLGNGNVKLLDERIGQKRLVRHDVEGGIVREVRPAGVARTGIDLRIRDAV